MLHYVWVPKRTTCARCCRCSRSSFRICHRHHIHRRQVHPSHLLCSPPRKCRSSPHGCVPCPLRSLTHPPSLPRPHTRNLAPQHTDSFAAVVTAIEDASSSPLLYDSVPFLLLRARAQFELGQVPPGSNMKLVFRFDFFASGCVRVRRVRSREVFRPLLPGRHVLLRRLAPLAFARTDTRRHAHWRSAGEARYCRS